FFEMLGNFSVGDYFKREAIAFAWEFVTQRFKLPVDRLYVTIYLDDDESFRFWNEEQGVPAERIYRYGGKDNFWGPAGSEGPCGPCTEIHYDYGAEVGCGLPMRDPRAEEGPGCHPNHDCERFVELWNLVLMQFYQDAKGDRTPLPAPNIDTGMGLERAAAILQGKRSVYETDLFWPIVQKVVEASGKKYGVDRETDIALRVVAEHARSVAFLIADAVVPGNEGRGYVLRRVIRRGIRFGRKLGLNGPFLQPVCDAAIQRFKAAYPELAEQREFILRVVGLEEERFGRTFQLGSATLNLTIVLRKAGSQYLNSWHKAFQQLVETLTSLSALSKRDLIKLKRDAIKVVTQIQDELQTFVATLKSEGEDTRRLDIAYQPLVDAIGAFKADVNDATEDTIANVANRGIDYLRNLLTTLSGYECFLLYDTYGFPPELTQEIAKEHGLDVDMEGFQKEMEAAREKARAGAEKAFAGSMTVLKAYSDLSGLDTHHVHFVGYERLAETTRVTAILVDGAPVAHARQGQQAEVVLESTPFYAEGGGQMGDTGVIKGPHGVVRVKDTQRPMEGLIVHVGTVEQGQLSLGDPVEAVVDTHRREDTERNHSATHLLQASLRRVLGTHVRQAGSLVAPDRLRFDFTHVTALSPDELSQVQSLVNESVLRDMRVTTRESTYREAIQRGALAFFGEKYGDQVRVVEMGDGEPFSVEVCGGTHVRGTGQVGPLYIVYEGSIGGGMRRVEAVTGRAAERLFNDTSATVQRLSQRLGVPAKDLESRVESLQDEVAQLRRRLEQQERQSLRGEAEGLLAQARDVDGVKVLAARTSATSVDAVRETGDFLKAKLGSAVIALGAVIEDKPLLVTMITPDLVSRGLHAASIAREAAKAMGGGGGGRPEMAQAGGRDATKLDEALRRVPELVRQALSK
ncbi:MAG: alanine--tRNA ligase, partial [Chloroflexota bacterium]|nr:alanine--tRNA ligase [Chloroflexota bacterium]